MMELVLESQELGIRSELEVRLEVSRPSRGQAYPLKRGTPPTKPIRRLKKLPSIKFLAHAQSSGMG
jgi:hypothetical protein